MVSVILEHINKSYTQGKRKIEAVNDVSLQIDEPQIFGLIGPDGAGKTTLFRIICTLLLPDSGKGTIHDLDIVKDYRKIRNIVGYMPGHFSLYKDLTVKENLHFFANLFHTSIEANYNQIKDIYQQIEMFKDRRAGNLSGGMKQKLALCCALIHKPQYLFLDEPTTGVDPVSRKEFWEMLHKLKREGIAIIVSTPYMDEAGQCDRIAFIQHGKILSTIRPDELLQKYRPKIWALSGEPVYELVDKARSYENTMSCLAFGDSHHLRFQNDEGEPESIRSFLKLRGFTDFSIKSEKPGLEDYFLDLLKN